MTNDNNIKGRLTELNCITAFSEMGAIVSIPFGEDSRYDFIADNRKKLTRVQCKTASPIYEDEKIAAIVFKTVRQGRSSGKWTRIKYTKQEIDYFATFWDGKCYIVPVGECSNEKTLRFLPTKNNQAKGINLAKDYELTEVYQKL